MRFVPHLLSLLLLSVSTLSAAEIEDVTFFESKVRPILVSQCYDCHSTTKKVKGGLAMDTRDDWARGGDAGPAIVPGKPEESLLIRAVSWKDLDLQMPPKRRLSATELAVLTEWVRRGAVDPRVASADSQHPKSQALSVEAGRQFWSYAPLKKTALPTVQNSHWPRTEVDHFILSTLEAKGMRPVSPTTAPALARRLCFVLTGLPPTPEQWQRFITEDAVDRDAAVRRFTDELMASTAFAERWASHWLDIVRFAESSGGGRTLLFPDAWRFRDYVVQSLQENRPLNQMIREHIAGDLLPAASPAERTRQLIATGFLALGPTIYEEQDKQRLRFDVIDEQLETLGKAFLGQTIGCARCHDHKFDPVTQRDYYALAGIFASTRTLSNYQDNVVSWIQTPLPLDAASERRFDEAEAELKAAEHRLKAAMNELAKQKDIASGLSRKTRQPLPLTDLAGVVIDDTQAQRRGIWKHSTHSPHFFGQGYLHDDGRDKGGSTLTFTPQLPHSGRYEVRLAYPALAGRSSAVPVHIFHAMGDVTVTIDQTQPPDIEQRFVSLGTYTFEKDGTSYVIVSNAGTRGYVTADLVQFLPEPSAPLPPVELSHRPASSALQVEVRDLEHRVATLKTLLQGRPRAMSVREEEVIADTHLRIRGEVHQKAALVPRGFLSVLTPSAVTLPSAQSGRGELAEWMVSDTNPLAARVMVNRLWSWLFGQGLVRSVDNFGTTGEPPTHPELLDHLARRFQTQGWDLRAFIRDIVSSRVWQLAAAHTPQDPENRWLSHAARRRLDAEQIRDSLLQISGALDPRVGGPNIEGAGTAAPDSAEASAVEFAYRFKDTRRSLYTPAFRNNRLELFATFDFSDNNTCQGQRSTTTVAPQALFFMNHPFVLQQAQLAARRSLALPMPDSERLHHAFRQTLGRAPLAAELRACQQTLQDSGSTPAAREEAWSIVYQSLFGSVDFRHLD